MTRDQFGRDLRKKIVGYISSETVMDLYRIFIGSERPDFNLFINDNLEEYGLTLKTSESKKYYFPKPTANQIQRHKEWKQKSAEKSALNLSKKPKKAINKYSKKGAIEKKEEGAAMRTFWDQHADHRGWCRCSETGKWIGVYKANFVHHIWTKGSNPASRCDMDNFIILSQEAHDLAHINEKSMRCYSFMKNRRQELKKKYAILAARNTINVATDIFQDFGMKLKDTEAVIKKLGKNLNKHNNGISQGSQG